MYIQAGLVDLSASQEAVCLFECVIPVFARLIRLSLSETYPLQVSNDCSKLIILRLKLPQH